MTGDCRGIRIRVIDRKGQDGHRAGPGGRGSAPAYGQVVPPFESAPVPSPVAQTRNVPEAVLLYL